MNVFDLNFIKAPFAIANPFSFHPDYIAVIMAVAGSLWLVSAVIALLTAGDHRKAGGTICRLACWIFIPAGIAIMVTFTLPNTPTYFPDSLKPGEKRDSGEPFVILVKEVRPEDRVLIPQEEGQSTEVYVPPHCLIEREGKPASFSDIQIGHRVEGIWRATSATAYSISRITEIAPHHDR